MKGSPWTHTNSCTTHSAMYNTLCEQVARARNNVGSAILLLTTLGGMLPGTKQVVDEAIKLLVEAFPEEGE